VHDSQLSFQPAFHDTCQQFYCVPPRNFKKFIIENLVDGPSTFGTTAFKDLILKGIASN
jgi:hypothetical protein